MPFSTPNTSTAYTWVSSDTVSLTPITGTTVSYDEYSRMMLAQQQIQIDQHRALIDQIRAATTTESRLHIDEPSKLHDFKVGDLVEYISKCSDHGVSWLKLNNVYKIHTIDNSGNKTILLTNPDGHGQWWVNPRHLSPIGAGPHDKIIRKIKQMESRRKANGYAF